MMVIINLFKFDIIKIVTLERREMARKQSVEARKPACHSHRVHRIGYVEKISHTLIQ
jgi:hypothetical protein